MATSGQNECNNAYLQSLRLLGLLLLVRSKSEEEGERGDMSGERSTRLGSRENRGSDIEREKGRGARTFLNATSSSLKSFSAFFLFFRLWGGGGRKQNKTSDATLYSVPRTTPPATRGGSERALTASRFLPAFRPWRFCPDSEG